MLLAFLKSPLFLKMRDDNLYSSDGQSQERNALDSYLQECQEFDHHRYLWEKSK